MNMSYISYIYLVESGDLTVADEHVVRQVQHPQDRHIEEVTRVIWSSVTGYTAMWYL